MGIKGICLFVIVWLCSTMSSHAVSTLHIMWNGDKVSFSPSKIKGIGIKHGKVTTDVCLRIGEELPSRIILTGKSDNGSLRLETASACTLSLEGLQLTSLNGPAIQVSGDGMVNVATKEKTENILCDSASYKKKDVKALVKACMVFTSPVEFSGNGVLKVIANKHNGIKCDTIMTVSGGCIDLSLPCKSASGLSCMSLNITGGEIRGCATGDIVYKDSLFKYPVFIKCKHNASITGGCIDIQHKGKGNRLIQCGDTLYVSGGDIKLTSTGNGGYEGKPVRGKHYWSVRDYRQYYSARCIKAGTCIIERGNIHCINSGTGGKGLAIEGDLFIGLKSDTISTQGPSINVETIGDCIVNDTLFDYRDGCPKGIKAVNMQLYSGNINVSTTHMGGEGIEADSLVIWHPNVVCNTYDDGINVEKVIRIYGGAVYCNSKDNDGIDSNGSLHINGGIVACISQESKNESLDAEHSGIYITSGTIFGVGNSTVKMMRSDVDIYNTPSVDNGKGKKRPDLHIRNGQYLCIMDGSKVVMTLKNTNNSERASVIATNPAFMSGKRYTLCISDNAPEECEKSYFSDCFFIGGKMKPDSLQTLKKFTTDKYINTEDITKKRHRL